MYKKLIFTLLFIITSYTIIVLYNNNKSFNSKTTYTGVLVDRIYEPPTSGYKSSRDPVYSIFMREKITGKVMRVNVNIPTYYDFKKGKVVSFKISNMNMYSLGNTSNARKNLYNK